MDIDGVVYCIMDSIILRSREVNGFAFAIDYTRFINIMPGRVYICT